MAFSRWPVAKDTGPCQFTPNWIICDLNDVMDSKVAKCLLLCACGFQRTVVLRDNTLCPCHVAGARAKKHEPPKLRDAKAAAFNSGH